jgi:hypothetical protein
MPFEVTAACGSAVREPEAPTFSTAPQGPPPARRAADIRLPAVPVCCQMATCSRSGPATRSKQLPLKQPGTSAGRSTTVCGEPHVPAAPGARSLLRTRPGGTRIPSPNVPSPHSTEEVEPGVAATSNPVIEDDPVTVPTSSAVPHGPPGGR